MTLPGPLGSGTESRPRGTPRERGEHRCPAAEPGKDPPSVWAGTSPAFAKPLRAPRPVPAGAMSPPTHPAAGADAPYLRRRPRADIRNAAETAEEGAASSLRERDHPTWWRGPRSDREPHPPGDPACPAIQWTTERDGIRSQLVQESRTARERVPSTRPDRGTKPALADRAQQDPEQPRPALLHRAERTASALRDAPQDDLVVLEEALTVPPDRGRAWGASPSIPRQPSSARTGIIDLPLALHRPGALGTRTPDGENEALPLLRASTPRAMTATGCPRGTEVEITGQHVPTQEAVRRSAAGTGTPAPAGTWRGCRRPRPPPSVVPSGRAALPGRLCLRPAPSRSHHLPAFAYIERMQLL